MGQKSKKVAMMIAGMAAVGALSGIGAGVSSAVPVEVHQGTDGVDTIDLGAGNIVVGQHSQVNQR